MPAARDDVADLAIDAASESMIERRFAALQQRLPQSLTMAWNSFFFGPNAMYSLLSSDGANNFEVLVVEADRVMQSHPSDDHAVFVEALGELMGCEPEMWRGCLLLIVFPKGLVATARALGEQGGFAAGG